MLQATLCYRLHYACAKDRLQSSYMSCTKRKWGCQDTCCAEFEFDINMLYVLVFDINMLYVLAFDINMLYVLVFVRFVRHVSLSLSLFVAQGNLSLLVSQLRCRK